MLMTLEEARNCVRVDENDEFDDAAILGMVQTAETYIQTSTGLTPEQMEAEPMAKTVAFHMLRQWYDMVPNYDLTYQRVIDSMLKVLTVKAREHNQ